MKVNFTFPEIQHPSGEKTILEVAMILEGKYHILENFSKYILESFKGRLLKQLKRVNGFNKHSLEEWLKHEWREYIIGGKTGVSTNAALFRNDPSFIDTSSYYLSMQPKLLFNDKEAKILKIR